LAAAGGTRIGGLMFGSTGLPAGFFAAGAEAATAGALNP
jgi:hypothetical protein